VNIPRSSPMEEEHTTTIIWLILSKDLALIQLKNSLKFFVFPTIPRNEWRFKELTHKETDSLAKSTLEKNLHPDK